MLKLLFIPTGNIFILPDEEAIRIKASDKGNYRILDAGYQEEAEEQVTAKTVKELVMAQDKAIAEQEAKDNPPAPVKKELPKYEDMKKNELRAVAKKLGLPVSNQYAKKDYIEMINKKLGK